ncbi:MAG: FAD-binding and (Fe-S)-binding domain-containing protein [Candidatus Eisenbacteria bacterium]|nr:FAD-binding and (Fe-S)-binding domain-containing protein [Candidatus Eisenbacteria bacterium]
MPKKKVSTSRKTAKKKASGATARKTRVKSAGRGKAAPSGKPSGGKMQYNKITPEIIRKIEAIVGKLGYTTAAVELRAYAADASMHLVEPSIVVRPVTAEQISKILKVANQHRIPVTPRAAGTSVCGQPVPIFGGILLDMQAMNKIKEVHVEDFYVVVEPGVIYAKLNDFLKKYKFFFPPAPGSGDVATIGGMLINNASGVNATKYGATRDYVLGCEIVLPTGEIIHAGTRTLKASSGYQLDRLMAASEGTLGIVTEINLRVVPVPKKRALAMAVFDDLEKAGQCVANIIAKPIIPASLELMDDICIKAVNKATKLGLPEVEAILLIAVDGHPAAVKDEIEQVAEVCKSAGAISLDYTDDPQRIGDIEKGRKAMIPSLSRFEADKVTVMFADDMAVPPSKVPKAVKAFHEIMSRYLGIYIPTYGHAGDGNLHTKFIMDPTDPQMWKNAEKANKEVFDAVLALGGTVSGEHGIAITKAPYFKKERADSLDVMRRIKRTLDPNNILNPGKMFDWDRPTVGHFLRYKVGPRKYAKGMETLARWEMELNACTQCGYCKSVCPTLADIGWDGAGTKGYLMSSYAMLHGDLKPDDKLVDRLFSCTMCLDCTRRCETKIEVAQIVEAGRAALVKAGYKMPVHVDLVKKVQETGNIFGEKEAAVKPQDGNVLLYLGCQYGQRLNMVKMFTRILDRLDVKTRIIEETCCGNPLKILGYWDEFEEQKKKFNAMVPGTELVTFCPTCTMFLREEYKRPVKHVLQAIAERLADRPVNKLGLRATYHDPCHLSRGAKVVKEPRDIMKTIGVELVEMPLSKDLSRCCGGGGGIITSAPELSSRLAVSRAEQAAATGADTVVTACATCELTLREGAKRIGNGNGLKVENLLDLVWKAIK